ncbi:hypothetical protein BGX33_008005 [Mortierella sp. NVP41]|nr:hypothetical protein BGX33_008005 [Mortierella sp. NVP41]
MLDHLQKPRCPRFNKYARQKLLLLEPNGECTPIESEHSDFSADICFSPYTCNEGLVRVRRRDRLQCKEANLRYPISGNATHDAFHRQFSGPDSFHVVFSGAEKLSPPDWYHAGQCLYVFPFHTSNPGKLALDITHLYDNFGAVVEQSKEWPVLHRKKIISNVPLEVCRDCPSHVARPRFSSLIEEDKAQESTSGGTETVSDLPGQMGKLASTDKSSLLALGMSSGSSLRNRYQAYTGSRSSRTNQYEKLLIDENHDRLPLCSRDYAVQDAWLPAHPLDTQSWRHANYTWIPLGCRFGKPLDRTCLARKKDAVKILFQDDTHLRVAMEELLRRLNGANTLQTTASSMATDRFEEKHEKLTFTYLHDPLFTHTGEKADMLLMSTSQYHDKLRDLIETIQQHARDLQDLQDEDDSVLGHFLDDGEDYSGEADDEDGHDYVIEEDVEEVEEVKEEVEEEDEAELERVRQGELATEIEEGTEEEEIYWEDETEQPIVVYLRPEDEGSEHPRSRRPTSKELEDKQEAMDDVADKYRVGDRHRAESEGYISREQNHDPLDRPRARYPSSRIFRQSKHVKTPAKPRIQIEGPEVDEEEEAEEEQERPPLVRNRYRYGAKKKIVLNNNSKLMMVDEKKDLKVHTGASTTATKTVTKKKKVVSKSRSASNPVKAGSAFKKTVVTKSAFRDPYAYSTRKITTILAKADLDSSNRKKSTSAGIKSTATTKNHLNCRAFLDDGYPFLKSPSSSSTSSKTVHSPTTSLSSSSFSSDFPGSMIKMAWVGMVAYPKTQSADPFVSHDWRTIYRLRYWNLIAEDVMLLHNVRFMDFFSMTLSMLDTSPDRAHYFGTDAAEAMLEELAFKLGLCEDE